MTDVPSSRVPALKSAAVIGGSTAVVMLIRVVRTKVIALLLGPAGVGVEALLDSVVNLSRTLFDCGVSSSGVRQVSAAVSSNNDRQIALTAYALRRVCFALGLVGGVTLFAARAVVSQVVFGNRDHASSVGVLALMLLLTAVTGGQGALLQGMRRIGDLARINIIGAMAGVIVTVPIVMKWGVAGIPYYMVLTAAAGSLVSWTYVRRVRIGPAALSPHDALREGVGLLRLGIAFLASTLLSTGALFLVRVLVSREQGPVGAGQFQAASTLSMVYVGFILQAMGTDFYPRLTAVASDKAQSNQLVNEQSEISLLLALPGILATIACAPWIVRLFYSGQFDQAATILCWQMSGTFLRVVSWPMGFTMLAQGRGTLFVLTDVAAWTTYLVLAWFGLRWFGLPGMGMAFLGLYAFHVVMIAAVVGRCSGFRWSGENRWLIVVGIITVAAAVASRLLLAEPWATGLGALLAVAVGLLSLRSLTTILGVTPLHRVLGRLLPSTLPAVR